MKPSGIHHVAICVRDADEAVTFYTDVLGLTVLDRPDFGFGGYWLDAGGQQVHLMQSETSRSGGDHFAIRVDDLESAVADIRATGYTVNTIDHMAGAGHQAFLHDPSGNFIELNQPDGLQP
jgi:catechol 2,3-dioxygenase-like lactoylglutathione lyase family enzyme